MAFIPISGIVPQATENGNQANGMVLKFYEPGTLTPLAVGIDSTGVTQTTEFVLDIEGYTTLTTTRVVPHVDQIYKEILYLNQADADANNTGSAVYSVDNLDVGRFSSSSSLITESYKSIAEALSSTTGIIGDFVKTFQYFPASGKGGAIYEIVAGGTGTPDGGGFLNKTDGSGFQLALQPEEGIVYATQWGIVSDGTTVGGTDNGPSINAAGTYARANRDFVNTVILPQGPLSIEEPIIWPQGINFLGYGTLAGSAGGTEFICNFSAGTIATPPTDNYTDRYSPVFAFTPMLYNTELMTQQSYGGFRLNGNDKDVYGIYLNEVFFTDAKPIFIIKCNKFPFTGLVLQFNNMELLTVNNCKEGLRFVGADTLNIRGLDTESNLIDGTTGTQLDFVQDQNFSTKGGNKIATWHFEETATNFPNVFGQISGRSLHIDESSFGTSGVPAQRFFHLMGNEAFSFDGVNITTEQAVGTYMGGHSASAAGSMGILFNPGATGSYLNVDSGTEQNSTDNSGNVSNQLNTTSGGQRLPRGVVVENSTGGTALFFSSDNRINFFNNLNRYIEQSGANMNINNDAGQMSLNASSNLNLEGTLVDIDAAGGVNAGRFDASVTFGDTRFLVYDVNNGTLERVTVGSQDSGGTGFKVLRIPN